MTTRLMNRTERLAVIERLLFRSAIGLRAVEIAEACDVDRRTIYRDLSLLTDIGVPIFQKDGRFHLNHEQYTAKIPLSFDESIALLFAARSALLQAEHHNPHIASALSKLSFALPPPIARHVETIIGHLRNSQTDYREMAVLEVLARAWAEQRKVKIWATGSEDGKPRVREFAPFLIEPAANGLIYVIGYDSLTHRLRTFKLQRVRRARLLQSTYQVPAHFDARRYMITGWGGALTEHEDRQIVTLIFGRDAAESVRRRHSHSAQQTELLEDKRLRLSFQVSDWRDMLNWVRSWGTQVEVIEPVEMREEMSREAARLVAQYGAVARS